MGTAKEQGLHWGARARDWVECAEPAWQEVYAAVLDQAGIGPGTSHLDIGCGSGGALDLARERGASVAGFDASENLAAIARERLPGASILIGDMERLPFADESFDAVTGINSFQFAGDVAKAFAEARRVVRKGGSVTMLVWGARDKCDLLGKVMPRIMALLPPSQAPVMAPLSETGEALMKEAALEPEVARDLSVQFVYPDGDTATKAILSASARAIRHAGEAAVRATVEEALAPFVGADGEVRLRNVFRLVTARRPADASLLWEAPEAKTGA